MACPKSCPSNKMLHVPKASQKAWTTPRFLFHHLLVKHFFQNNMHLSMLFYVTEHRVLQWRTHKDPRTEGNLTVEPANPIMMALVSVTGSMVTRDNFETISDCTQVLIRQDKTHSKNA